MTIDPQDAIQVATVVAQSTAVAVVARRVYPDLAQPVMRQVGYTLETAGVLANAALRPLRTAVLAMNLVSDAADEWLRRRFKTTPPEKIVEPPANVAGPLMLQLAFIHDDPEMAALREMYLELLASSMHSDRQRLCHPAFVKLLGEMTPSEARLVGHLSQQLEGGATLPIYPITEARLASGDGYVSVGEFFDLGAWDAATGVETTLLGNLARLGVLTINYGKSITDPSVYATMLEKEPYWHRLNDEHPGRISPVNGILQVTGFGAEFMKACTVVESKSAKDRTA